MAEAAFSRGDNGQVQLRGELSFATVPALLAQWDDLVAGCDQLSLDLSEVSRADSAGLAMMIEFLRRAQMQSLTLRLHHVPSQMMDIARVSGVDHILPLESA